MSDEPEDIKPDQEENLRWFAEKIIAGEFKELLICMVDMKDTIHTYRPGSYVSSLGLATWAVTEIKNEMLRLD